MSNLFQSTNRLLLHFYCFRAVVEVLLHAGFNVNMRTKSGTALHEAALCGKVEVVRTLLEHGANTSIRDSNNFTVIDLLSQFNTAQASQEIMMLLKRESTILYYVFHSYSYNYSHKKNITQPHKKKSRVLGDTFSRSLNPNPWSYLLHRARDLP